MTETTLLVLILIVLVERLIPGGVAGLALRALAALVMCAAIVAVVGAVAYVCWITPLPWWGTLYLLVFGAVWTWIGGERPWKLVAAWKHGAGGAE